MSRLEEIRKRNETCPDVKYLVDVIDDLEQAITNAMDALEEMAFSASYIGLSCAVLKEAMLLDQALKELETK